MHTTLKLKATLGAVTFLAAGAFVFQSVAADGKDVIEEVMKTYHKAPKGTDPTCKRAADGKATPEELKKLVIAYKSMAKTKAPKGDQASWKEKTATLLSAAEAMQKGAPDGIARYKQAVDCKACHSVHKPD